MFSALYDHAQRNLGCALSMMHEYLRVDPHVHYCELTASRL
jgi:hypothetical protein